MTTMTHKEVRSELIQNLWHSNPEVRDQSRDALIAMGQEIVDDLAQVMLGINSSRARDVMEVLARIKDPRSLEALRCALLSKNAIIGQAAVEALVRFDQNIAVNQFINALNQVNILVQISIIQAFAQLANRRAIQPLLDLLATTQSPTLRYLIIDTLGKLPEKRIMPIITRYLYDEDYQVRKHARMTLHQILTIVPTPCSEVD